MNRVMVLV